MNTFERIIKRAFDFTLALVSLIFFSPLIALIALLIKWEDSKGDVIYRQERIGYKGKPFTLYKFRSMRMDAEAGNRPQLFTDGDSRLTKVGAFIRAHHLDSSAASDVYKRQALECNQGGDVVCRTSSRAPVLH